MFYLQFDPVIQKGHEPFVHHMILYKCGMPHKYIGKEYDCYNVPYGLMPCGNVVAGWAVGGGVSKTVLYVLISHGNFVVDRFFLAGYYPTFNDIRYRFKSQVTFQAINQ